MPTYDYKCDACGHGFEKFQSISASPLRKCPECGENRLKRLIGTGAGVIFKGGGFYQTDYRSESYKADAKRESGGDGGAKPDAGKSDGGKADAGKPEAPKKEPPAGGGTSRKPGGEPPKKKSA